MGTPPSRRRRSSANASLPSLDSMLPPIARPTAMRTEMEEAAKDVVHLREAVLHRGGREQEALRHMLTAVIQALTGDRFWRNALRQARDASDVLPMRSRSTTQVLGDLELGTVHNLVNTLTRLAMTAMTDDSVDIKDAEICAICSDLLTLTKGLALGQRTVLGGERNEDAKVRLQAVHDASIDHVPDAVAFIPDTKVTIEMAKEAAMLHDLTNKFVVHMVDREWAEDLARQIMAYDPLIKTLVDFEFEPGDRIVVTYRCHGKSDAKRTFVVARWVAPEKR